MPNDEKKENLTRNAEESAEQHEPCQSQPTSSDVPAAPMPDDTAGKEDALLEAAEQVFGSKPVNAKSLGHWAKGIENAFVEAFILRRRINPHTKSNQLRVEVVKRTIGT